jgi:hypothetical protein
MGQVMTPPWIVSYINDSVIGKVEEMEEGAEGRWKVVLDPCTGSGRFLLDLAWRHGDRKLGIRIDARSFATSYSPPVRCEGIIPRYEVVFERLLRARTRWKCM